jgi:hypothetical protein
MNSMTSGWAYSGYNSDNPVLYTWEWDFAPSYTVGQTTIQAFDWGDGGKNFVTGAISYRYRPDPDGADQVVSLSDQGDFLTWAPYVYADQCTGITFGTWVGSQAELHVIGNLFSGRLR